MIYPNFTDPQFVDANGVGGLNTAFGTVSGAFASTGSGVWSVPGLLAPDAMAVTFSGMTANVSLPSPWGLVAVSGTVVRAHGTQTNQDTQAYAVSFTSLVPASGSVTAFLAATVQQIQQNSFAIPGPPPGHPSFNPNYVPTVGYASNVYSVALAAVTGGIDNVNTFELFRTTLTAGQVTLSVINTVGQVRAGHRRAWPAVSLTSGGTLSPFQAQTVLYPTVSGLTHTLPPVSGAGGLTFGFVNPTNGNETIATTGTDRIAGLAASGLASVAIASSGAMVLWGNAPAGQWQVMAASPVVPVGSYVNRTAGAFNFTVPVGVYEIDVTLNGGGSGGGASNTPDKPGAGGGGGARCWGRFAVLPGQVWPGVIGTGGAAGVIAGPTNGQAGTASTFMGMTAGAGTGGSGWSSGISAGGTGGTATGGQENTNGGTGSAAVQPSGGFGGGSPGGGNPAGVSSGEAYPGSSPGGGGGGAGSGADHDGSPGADGGITIRWPP